MDPLVVYFLQYLGLILVTHYTYTKVKAVLRRRRIVRRLNRLSWH